MLFFQKLWEIEYRRTLAIKWKERMLHCIAHDSKYFEKDAKNKDQFLVLFEENLAINLELEHTHTDVTSPTRADLNFLTHFTAKGGPLIFEWSPNSM